MSRRSRPQLETEKPPATEKVRSPQPNRPRLKQRKMEPEDQPGILWDGFRPG